MYKQQIFNALKCKAISSRNLESLAYNSKDLSKLFKRYNQCISTTTKSEPSKNKKNVLLHLNINTGFSFNSLDFSHSYYNISGKTTNELSYRVGSELTYEIPYFNNVWHLLLETSYASYEFNGTIENSNIHGYNPEGFYGTYSNFDIGLGFRYNYTVNKKITAFTNFNTIFSKSTNPEHVKYKDSDVIRANINNDPINYNTFGLGIRIYKRASLEYRLTINSRLITSTTSIPTLYLKNQFIILGYRLF